ncbi:MAG: hypothetical protein HJJLKODD_02694 [Phycisphaerae bacterium]|nr:hypothetical protein [Phycisphaerae bacterium]
MKYQVHLFGPLAEMACSGLVEVDWPERHECTAAELMQHLAMQYPEMGRRLGVGFLAVNCRRAAPEQQLQVTDELAVIGLVSGG